MIRLTRATPEEKKELLRTALDAPVASPSMLNIVDGLIGPVPSGFNHDVSRSELGHGLQVFEAASEALRTWKEFDLGWVRVIDQGAAIAPGQLVGVEAHTACFWSINLSRIVETVDTSTRFGFLYATTGVHVEEGQERFVVEFHPTTETVSYFVEAVSRPRHPLARTAYWFSRAMQRRFARDTHRKMRELCSGGQERKG